METTPVCGSVLRPRRLATSSLDRGSIFSGFFGRVFCCCWRLLLLRRPDGGVARKASAAVDMEDARDNSKIVAVEGNFILVEIL